MPAVADPPVKRTCRTPSSSTCPNLSSSAGWLGRAGSRSSAKRTSGVSSDTEVTCSRLPAVHSTSRVCSVRSRWPNSVRLPYRSAQWVLFAVLCSSAEYASQKRKLAHWVQRHARARELDTPYSGAGHAGEGVGRTTLRGVGGRIAVGSGDFFFVAPPPPLDEPR